MKTLIICESIHNGDTRKIVEAMVNDLNVVVKRPAEVDAVRLREYDLTGFGSGLHNGKLHPHLLKLAQNMSMVGKAAFVFSTSSIP
ncbi:MAG TPA: hypothetical protein VK436_02210 [Methanocella sp.]|nr:hypothetical protein [Methanocella sp.]